MTALALRLTVDARTAPPGLASELGDLLHRFPGNQRVTVRFVMTDEELNLRLGPNEHVDAFNPHLNQALTELLGAAPTWDRIEIQ